MDSPGEILRLCRLCLVKDQVNIPIFDEQGDTRQIFLKISSCLPVKVSREDRLPKKICDGCSEKLNSFYEFWSSSANAEKTLLSWVGQEEEEEKKEPTIPKPIAALVKEESEVGEETPVESIEESTKDEAEAPPAKRARRSAAVKAQINITPESEDDDLDNAEPMTKLEDESAESDSEDKDPSYTDIPGTSADDEQAGPSGVGKDGVEAPLLHIKKLSARKPLPGISFQCSHCRLKFPSLAGLTKHIELHCDRTRIGKTNVPLKCSDCRRKFGSLVTLKAHLKRGCPKLKETKSVQMDPEDLLSKLPGIRAKVVPRAKNYTLRNGRKGTTKSSTQWDSNKFFFICPNCPQIFSSQELLDSHTDKCTLNEYLVPKKTPKSIESYRFDRIINMYICVKCDEKFDFKSAIEEHLKTAHPHFTCDVCHKSFESLIQFGYHTAKHNDNAIMTCPCCSIYETKSRNDLAFHIQTEHQVEVNTSNCEEVVCVVCSKSFYDSKKLQHHQKNYHKVTVDVEPSMGGRLLSPPAKSQPQEPLLCDTCGKYFSSKYRLERHHRAMHQGLKPFECRFCGRAFTGKDTMKKHERIHTGERPYSCEYCGKCFRQPGPFSVHLRIHTGERPYQCKFCKKGFITNQMRKSHMKNCPGRLAPGLDYGDYVFVPTVDFV